MCTNKYGDERTSGRAANQNGRDPTERLPGREERLGRPDRLDLIAVELARIACLIGL